MDLTFYATLDASTLKPYLQDLPYLLPLASWWRSDVQLNRPPRLPSQLTHVAIDCGSYTLAQHQLQPGFHFTAEQYVSWIRALGPAVSWAVLPDWPCENVGASEVRRRQVATTNTAVDVLSDYLDAAWCWCPVLQGQHVDDYLRHAIDIAAWVYDLREVYARRGLAGSFRVCLGSLCRRNSLAYIRSIVSQVAQVLPRLPLHLFGVNSTSSSRRATCRMRSSALIAPPGPGVSDAGSTCRPTSNAAPAAIVVSWNSPDGAPHRLGALDAVVRSESRNASTAFSLPYPDIARDFNGHCWQAVARWMQEVNPFQIRMHSGRVGSPGQHEFRSSELRNRHGDSEQMLPDDSFEAAVMAGDQAATDWLRGCERAEPDPMDAGP
ncbi:MAG: hypothetical protein JOZ81_09280, partial [Chloroflexi bacterium]|nr:hypothetical protein [Chloroflexota bacterium]